MKKNVLVPIDGSAYAMRALERAIAAVKGSGGVLHMVRVIPPMDDYGMVPAYITRQHRRMIAERAAELLAPAVVRARRARVPHEAHVLWGEIAETIVRAARRLRCDAIVMGTHGRGATANLLLGSIAAKVVHFSKVPVTLVK